MRATCCFVSLLFVVLLYTSDAVPVKKEPMDMIETTKWFLRRASEPNINPLSASFVIGAAWDYWLLTHHDHEFGEGAKTGFIPKQSDNDIPSRPASGFWPWEVPKTTKTSSNEENSLESTTNAIMSTVNYILEDRKVQRIMNDLVATLMAPTMRRNEDIDDAHEEEDDDDEEEEDIFIMDKKIMHPTTTTTEATTTTTEAITTTTEATKTTTTTTTEESTTELPDDWATTETESSSPREEEDDFYRIAHADDTIEDKANLGWFHWLFTKRNNDNNEYQYIDTEAPFEYRTDEANDHGAYVRAQARE